MSIQSSFSLLIYCNVLRMQRQNYNCKIILSRLLKRIQIIILIIANIICIQTGDLEQKNMTFINTFHLHKKL